MAKVSFSKLKLKKDAEIKTIIFNEQSIEVETYLPINNKLNMIGDIIQLASDDKLKFYNVGKLEVFFTLEVIFNYTNINFTDKQKEDVCDLYDRLCISGLKDKIFDCIPEEELEFIHNTLMKTVKSIYKYQNSVLGILDTIQKDYSDLSLDAENIQKELSDPENLELLKSIMAKLG